MLSVAHLCFFGTRCRTSVKILRHSAPNGPGIESTLLFCGTFSRRLSDIFQLTMQTNFVCFSDWAQPKFVEQLWPLVVIKPVSFKSRLCYQEQHQMRRRMWSQAVSCIDPLSKCCQQRFPNLVLLTLFSAYTVRCRTKVSRVFARVRQMESKTPICFVVHFSWRLSDIF